MTSSVRFSPCRHAEAVDELLGRHFELEPRVALGVGPLLEHVAGDGRRLAAAAVPTPTVSARFGLLSSSMATTR